MVAEGCAFPPYSVRDCGERWLLTVAAERRLALPSTVLWARLYPSVLHWTLTLQSMA